MEKPDIVIEKMQTKDIPEVAGIEARVFSMPWSEQGFADALKQDTIFVTAKQEGQVVGYCGMYCSFEEGEITNVAVLPEAQNLRSAESFPGKKYQPYCVRSSCVQYACDKAV